MNLPKDLDLHVSLSLIVVYESAQRPLPSFIDAVIVLSHEHAKTPMVVLSFLCFVLQATQLFFMFTDLLIVTIKASL